MSEERLAELRREIAELERKKLTKEAQADQADAAFKSAQERLKTEFGVETADEAALLLEAKKQKMDEALRKIEEALNE